MKQAKISELKNQLSRYLDLVRSGETIQVLDRDVPIAQITPIPNRTRGASSDDDARLADLERRGIVRRGRGRVPRCIAEGPLEGASAGVLDALLEERREGR